MLRSSLADAKLPSRNKAHSRAIMTNSIVSHLEKKQRPQTGFRFPHKSRLQWCPDQPHVSFIPFASNGSIIEKSTSVAGSFKRVYLKDMKETAPKINRPFRNSLQLATVPQQPAINFYQHSEENISTALRSPKSPPISNRDI